MASSRAATKGPKVAPVSARRPPVPVSAEKGVADRMYKNKWRAGECQQAKTSVTSSASSRQLGSQLAPAGRETRALPTRSRSLDISSESQNLVGSVDPSRLECGVGGVSEQSVPQSASVCSLRKRVEVRVCACQMPSCDVSDMLHLYEQSLRDHLHGHSMCV